MTLTPPGPKRLDHLVADGHWDDHVVGCVEDPDLYKIYEIYGWPELCRLTRFFE